MTLTDIVKDKVARFKYYRDGELWYETQDGFEFPIPISDTGTGIFNAEDRAIVFMRWIRKHLAVRVEWEKERAAHARNIQATTDAVRAAGAIPSAAATDEVEAKDGAED